MAAFTVSRSSLPCLFLARVLILLAFHSPSAAFKGKEQTFLNFFFSPSAFVHSLSSFASLLSFGMHFYKKKKKKVQCYYYYYFLLSSAAFYLFFFFLKRMEEKRQTCHCVAVKCNKRLFYCIWFSYIYNYFYGVFCFFYRTLIFFSFAGKKKKKKKSICDRF